MASIVIYITNDVTKEWRKWLISPSLPFISLCITIVFNNLVTKMITWLPIAINRTIINDYCWTSRIKASSIAYLIVHSIQFLLLLHASTIYYNMSKPLTIEAPHISWGWEWSSWCFSLLDLCIHHHLLDLLLDLFLSNISTAIICFSFSYN